jgi:hypothetical protein
MGKVKGQSLTETRLHMRKKDAGITLKCCTRWGKTTSQQKNMTMFNPNNDPVYSIPLSELVNLWRARYGDTWVDVSEIEEDFWSDASARLHSKQKDGRTKPSLRQLAVG